MGKNKFIFLTFIVALFIFNTSIVFASSFDAIANDAEIQFLEMINQARHNCQLLVQDTSVIPKKQTNATWNELNFFTPLPPLQMNDQLKDVAYNFNQKCLSGVDLILEGFESKKEGIKILLTDKGYDPSLFSFDQHIVCFDNYLPIDAWLDFFFEEGLATQMNIQPELLKMLHPWYEDVGINIVAGAVTYNGQDYNIYLVTSVYALSKCSVVEDAVQSRLNRLRSSPYSFSQWTSLSDEQEQRYTDRLKELYIYASYPPLARAKNLNEAASEFGRKVLAGEPCVPSIPGYIDDTLQIYVVEVGQFQDQSALQIAEGICTEMLAKDLVYCENDRKGIYDERLTELGISIINTFQPERRQYQAVVVTGRPESPRKFVIGAAKPELVQEGGDIQQFFVRNAVYLADIYDKKNNWRTRLTPFGQFQIDITSNNCTIPFVDCFMLNEDLHAVGEKRLVLGESSRYIELEQQADMWQLGNMDQ